MPRYRFSDFTLSPRRRMLARGGRERPLIPRYFDLLVFLIEHRHEAVHRRDIFDHVWKDVVVSDSALSQAVRTIRRTLEDDPREPRFIRTVSRHGYRFVFPEVFEETDDDHRLPPETRAPALDTSEVTAADPFEPLLQRVTDVANDLKDEEEQREAAELLHSLGTSEALRRLGTRPRHEHARALLRDTRWETAGAGAVPLVGQPAAIGTARALTGLRLRRDARIVASRWAAASIGGAAAGLAAGALGGLLLSAAPGSSAPVDVAAVLAIIGGICGGVAGSGVGAGLAVAEAVARSERTLALVCGGALGGGLAGSAVQWLARWSLAALVGVHIEIRGGLEGLAIGGAAGLGFAIATRRMGGGLAAPRGWQRARTAALIATACGLAALGLTRIGRPLVGGTIHLIAQTSSGSQASLAPLGRLIGEPDFGPVARAVIGTGEGALFGIGLALGLTHRPRN